MTCLLGWLPKNVITIVDDNQYQELLHESFFDYVLITFKLR